MGWDHIYGHDDIVEQFRRALARGRLGNSFLFVGPAGIGKMLFARELARALLCEVTCEQTLNACAKCPACQQVQALTHPDFELVQKPADKNFLPVELFIGDKEHRMREGLCHWLGLKPFHGGRKIAVINDADYLNAESANCLLKTLEEPPPRSILILIGTSVTKQLPTICSRCQIIRFRPLEVPVVQQILDQSGLVEDRQQFERLAALSGGSVQRVLELADSQFDEFRGQFYSYLEQIDGNTAAYAKTVGEFVDAAGRDAPPRRQRMRQIVQLGMEFYRALMFDATGYPLEIWGDLHGINQATWIRWRGCEEIALRCIDRCLDTLWQIDANANQTNLIECWLDDLAQISRLTGRKV